MNGCIYRTKDGECDLYAEGGKYKAFCDMDGCKSRKMSNADSIRAMSDDELAKFIYRNGYGNCPNLPVCPQFASKKMPPTEDKCEACWLDWLKKEVEE